MASVGSSTEKPHTVGWAPIDSPEVQYKKPERVPKQEMDRDTFLKLLVAQMKYQDPSSPMDMNAMMQQTASMTSVEKLTEMASIARNQFELQQQAASASMLGKHVAYVTSDGASATGIANSVKVMDGQAHLKVGNTLVALDRVSAISNEAIELPPGLPAESANGDNTTETASGQNTGGNDASSGGLTHPEANSDAADSSGDVTGEGDAATS